jgi:hypothetical protein
MIKDKPIKSNLIYQTKVKSNLKQDLNLIPGTQSIFVKTFGCSHNISDSEFMIGQLAEYGYNIVDSI